ncbi:MAG: amidohydrolase family protein [Ekhidna sp.]
MKTIYFLSFMILFSCGSTKEKYDLIITNVNLIDGTGAPIQPGVNVHVKDRLIAKIDIGEISQTVNIVDGTGKFLIPGLFDGHAHTSDYSRDFPKLMHYGITSIFTPGGSTCTNKFYAEMRAVGNQDSIPAPRVFHTSQHLTMEGRHPVRTYASSNWRENETVFFLKDTAQISRLVKQMARYPILGIKLTIEDGPSPPFVQRIPQEFVDKTVVEAAKYGLEVFAHTSDNEEFLMAAKAGAQNLVHFVGTDIDWENPEHLEAVETLMRNDASIVTTLMIDKSFLYPLHPEWVNEPLLNEVYPKEEILQLFTPQAIAKAERMEELTLLEYNLDQATLDAIYQPKIDDIIRLLEMNINMVLGTDTGNDYNFHGYSLHEEMRILQSGGIQPIDIIKMGTMNASIMVHGQDSLGSIETGKLADMILLDANPLEDIANVSVINTIYKGGRVQKRISH